MKVRFFLFVLFIGAIISPPLVAMSQNQIKLIKFESQFEGFEKRFGLQRHIINQNRKISYDRGSGNYCIFSLERTYNYVPTSKESIEMSRYVFHPVAVRADKSNAKHSISQKASNLRIYVEDGPRNNLFDPRCG